MKCLRDYNLPPSTCDFSLYFPHFSHKVFTTFPVVDVVGSIVYCDLNCNCCWKEQPLGYHVHQEGKNVFGPLMSTENEFWWYNFSGFKRILLLPLLKWLIVFFSLILTIKILCSIKSFGGTTCSNCNSLI